MKEIHSMSPKTKLIICSLCSGHMIKRFFFESVSKVGEEKAHKHIHNCPTQCFKVYLDRQSDTFHEPHQIFRYIYQRKIKSIYITMPNTHLQG